jgi:hypothetical protein
LTWKSGECRKRFAVGSKIGNLVVVRALLEERIHQRDACGTGNLS